MARLRYNGLTATLGADLLTAGTTITFTAALTHAAGAVPTITGTDYIPLAILADDGTVLEIMHLTAYTTGATTGTVLRAQESTTATDHGSGLRVVHGLTVADVDELAAATGSSVSVYKAKRTTTLSLNTAGAWADVDTALDLVVPAAAGDRIELSMAARALAPGGTTYGVLDFHTVVSGTATNSVAADGAISTTVSQPGWAYGQITTTTYVYFLGPKTYIVAAGDLDGGNVRLRLRGRTGASVSFDGGNDPYLYVQAVNYGQ